MAGAEICGQLISEEAFFDSTTIGSINDPMRAIVAAAKKNDVIFFGIDETASDAKPLNLLAAKLPDLYIQGITSLHISEDQDRFPKVFEFMNSKRKVPTVGLDLEGSNLARHLKTPEYRKLLEAALKAGYKIAGFDKLADVTVMEANALAEGSASGKTLVVVGNSNVSKVSAMNHYQFPLAARLRGTGLKVFSVLNLTHATESANPQIATSLYERWGARDFANPIGAFPNLVESLWSESYQGSYFKYPATGYDLLIFYGSEK